MIDSIDHLESMRDRLPSHLRGGANLDSLLSVFAAQYQDIERAFVDMLTLRSIDISVGAQLDGIGQVIDSARTVGQSDTEYRTVLRTRVIALTKSGEVETVIRAYIDLTRAGAVQYTEIYPATFQLSAIVGVDITDPAVVAFVLARMETVKAAGVGMILTFGDGFEFSRVADTHDGGNGPSDPAHGFGGSRPDQTLGGGLASLFLISGGGPPVEIHTDFFGFAGAANSGFGAIGEPRVGLGFAPGPVDTTPRFFSFSGAPGSGFDDEIGLGFAPL